MTGPQACDLAEAARYLPAGTPDEQRAFAERQLRARARLTRMYAFYAGHRCRMVRVHLLSSCALVVARFAGFSRSYDLIGEALCPVDAAGRPRTALWEAYAICCGGGRPRDVCEEAWLTAHLADLRETRDAGLPDGFEAEAAEVARRAGGHDDADWKLLRQHVAVTLGTRLADDAALRGEIPVETAVAASLRLGLSRLAGDRGALVRRYVGAGLAALLWPPGEPARPGVAGYRWTAIRLLWFAVRAWTALRVYRLGVRRRERGAEALGGTWSLVPLLERVLGDEAARMHPLVRRFFDDMTPFRITASAWLNTSAMHVGARVGALVVGQGMYETAFDQVDARFRVFRRADGSAHFLREFFCADAVRVFDSDFVVREVEGLPTCCEVFVDLDTAAVMDTRLEPDGGVSMTIRSLVAKGRRMRTGPFRVCFVTRVLEDGDDPRIDVTGTLEFLPQRAWERFFFVTLLRRPRDLGGIRYVARLSADGTSPSVPAPARPTAG